MLRARHLWLMSRELVSWARCSGRVWIPLLLPVLLLAALLVASTKAVVTTAVYTLF